MVSIFVVTGRFLPRSFLVKMQQRQRGRYVWERKRDINLRVHRPTSTTHLFSSVSSSCIYVVRVQESQQPERAPFTYYIRNPRLTGMHYLCLEQFVHVAIALGNKHKQRDHRPNFWRTQLLQTALFHLYFQLVNSSVRWPIIERAVTPVEWKYILTSVIFFLSEGHSHFLSLPISDFSQNNHSSGRRTRL